nr:hypothetical protein [Tanacetum cinerariifolium]
MLNCRPKRCFHFLHGIAGWIGDGVISPIIGDHDLYYHVSSMVWRQLYSFFSILYHDTFDYALKAGVREVFKKAFAEINGIVPFFMSHPEVIEITYGDWIDSLKDFGVKYQEVVFASGCEILCLCLVELLEFISSSTGIETGFLCVLIPPLALCEERHVAILGI